MDHVPPKQFHPKQTRNETNPNLWTVPTHKRCNAEYREDEEYFYHAAYPLVQKTNPVMGEVFHRDLARRIRRPQTPAMVRNLLRDCRTVTDAGIYLPPRVIEFNLDARRMERVAIKIAQGLLYRDQGRHIPWENCKDIRLCESETDVPELYRLSWSAKEAKVQSVIPRVFSYRRCKFDSMHLLSMCCWEAFMFCVLFEDPAVHRGLSGGDDK